MVKNVSSLSLYDLSVRKENELSLLTTKEPDSLVSGNSKTGQSFRSLLRFCSDRTDICSSHCYACRGPISWNAPILKSLSVRKWIDCYGVKLAAKRLATEIGWNSIFRWMDRGDFDEVTIELANRVAKLRTDVRFCATSRQLSSLKSLSSSISRVFSIDKSSFHLLDLVSFSCSSNIKVAYLQVDDEDINIRDKRISIVFPLNKRRSIPINGKTCSFAKAKNKKCNGCGRCY